MKTIPIPLILVNPGNATVDYARAAGIAFGVIQKSDSLSEHQLAHAAFVLPVDRLGDIANDERILHEIRRYLGTDTGMTSVWSFTEEGLLPAAQLAARLGARGLSLPAILLSRDKFLFRSALNAGPFTRVRTKLVSAESDLHDFARSVGFPFIAKPRVGTAWRGVTLVRSPDEVARAWSHGISAYPELVAEEYVEGPE